MSQTIVEAIEEIIDKENGKTDGVNPELSGKHLAQSINDEVISKLRVDEGALILRGRKASELDWHETWILNPSGIILEIKKSDRIYDLEPVLPKELKALKEKDNG